ncbi:MAG: radical SAM protein [Synergistaceae bacterium]|nr:radical SAM protein [Synergistaceae bacterium]
MQTISQEEFLYALLESSSKSEIPATGLFELTPLCNLDCKMCYVHLNDPSVKEQLLDGKQWISIIKEAISGGMVSATLTGGEALTHPDFWAIYDCLVQAGVLVHVKSNGVLLNEENVERLKQYPPERIDVSLYGCDRESYIAVTGRDVFDIVDANIKSVIAAGLPLYIAITPSKPLMPWLERTLEYLKDLDVSGGVNLLLNEPREETGRVKSDFDLTIDEYLYVHQRKKELFPKEAKLTEGQKLFREDMAKRPHVSERGLYCGAARTAFAVCWDGTMLPCPGFPKEIASANVLQGGFVASWQKINRAVKNYSVPEKCHSCSYNTRCHYCPAQHGKCALRHECDERVCEFGQKYCDWLQESKKLR